MGADGTGLSFPGSSVVADCRGERGPECYWAPERTSDYFPLTMVQKSATTPSML